MHANLRSLRVDCLNNTHDWEMYFSLLPLTRLYSRELRGRWDIHGRFHRTLWADKTPLGSYDCHTSWMGKLKLREAVYVPGSHGVWMARLGLHLLRWPETDFFPISPLGWAHVVLYVYSDWPVRALKERGDTDSFRHRQCLEWRLVLSKRSINTRHTN